MARPRHSVLLLILLLLLAARPAAAYVDPAAGSMMLQLLLGGIAGLGVAVRLLWRRLLTRAGARRAAAGAREGRPERPGGA